MSNRKYLRLADGYHERSPYNQYQSSGKYSTKQSNVVSEGRSERSSNINGGTGSRNNSPRSRHSNLSPRSHRIKSSYSKTKELSKRGSSSSPVDTVSHHGHSSSVGEQVLKVDSISTDESFPWSQHTSSSGKTYYYNCRTEKSQWEKPKEWLEREHRIAREKKKREAKDKGEYSRNNLHSNQASSSRDKTSSSRDSNRECSNSAKQDSQGSSECKYESNLTRDRTSHHREEVKRSSQHGQATYQPNSLVVKTTSANTSAVSTALHRPDQLSARGESTVSPSSSLQDISPPVTPITVSLQNSSPCITAASPVITRSPILLAHQQSPNLQNQSPVQPSPQRHLTSHHGNSSTPPPPPPPLSLHTSPAPPLPSGTPQVHCTEGSFPNALPMNHDVGGSVRLTEDSSFNGVHVLSQSKLHPLQQATLLQAQFQSTSNVQPMTSALLTGSPPAPPKPYFQPIKQSTSAPASPLSFSARSYPGSPAVHGTCAASPRTSLVYPPAQIVNIQDFAVHFNRGLISHTIGWPSESVEKQAQRSSDDTLGLCFANNRLKADLIPLNYHQKLTGMRMAVGAKRIKFLREQTRKLETSDSIS